MCTPTQGVWQPAGCVSCEPVCVCVSLVRVVIICLASTHTALVSSPSLAVLHLSTYLPTEGHMDHQELARAADAALVCRPPHRRGVADGERASVRGQRHCARS